MFEREYSVIPGIRGSVDAQRAGFSWGIFLNPSEEPWCGQDFVAAVVVDEQSAPARGHVPSVHGPKQIHPGPTVPGWCLGVLWGEVG